MVFNSWCCWCQMMNTFHRHCSSLRCPCTCLCKGNIFWSEFFGNVSIHDSLCKFGRSYDVPSVLAQCSLYLNSYWHRPGFNWVLAWHRPGFNWVLAWHRPGCNWVLAWLSGIALVSINVVTLRQARLGRVNYLGAEPDTHVNSAWAISA